MSFNENTTIDVFRVEYKLAPSTIPEQITTTIMEAKRGVWIKSPSANTNTIFLSNSSRVVTGNTTRGGYPIDPGEEKFIPIDDPRKVYCLGGASGQHLKIMVF